MTIKEYAKNKGITPQAIYGKLSSSGIAVGDIVSPDSKEITPHGQAILDKYYPADDSLTIKVRALQSSNAELTRQLETLKAQNAEIQALKARVTLLEFQLDKQIADTNKAMQDANKWQEMAFRLSEPRLSAGQPQQDTQSAGRDQSQPAGQQEPKQKKKKHKHKKH